MIASENNLYESVVQLTAFLFLCRVPNGVTRRQYLVNILLDVMVQDTGFSVSYHIISLRTAC